MFKLLCLFAVLLVVSVSGMPHNAPEWLGAGPVPSGRLVKREIPTKSSIESGPSQAKDGNNDSEHAAEEQDDMEKAETFGFGYHHYYTYPRYYYPSYYYGYYPRYSYGYYW